MKKHLTFLLIILSTVISAQTEIKGKLLNSKNNTPIEFANIWLVGKNMGTTSDLNGSFRLAIDSINANKAIKISAIGFNDTTINIKNLIDYTEIKLHEKDYQISEVIIKPNHKPKKIILNKVRQKDIFVRVVSTNIPRIIANYFPYDESLDNTMLKEIIIPTYLNHQDYLCNIRLYKAENTLPSQELLNKNITCVAKKGTRNIKVDLSGYKLEFPKEGIFVCFEWLIIDQNKRNITLIDEETNKEYNDIDYGPVLAGVAEEKPNQLIYFNGEWKKYEEYIGSDHWAAKKHMGKYCNLGISLIILK